MSGTKFAIFSAGPVLNWRTSIAWAVTVRVLVSLSMISLSVQYSKVKTPVLQAKVVFDRRKDWPLEPSSSSNPSLSGIRDRGGGISKALLSR
jgi:hypothetical protein